jgi:TRAP transporter TAXI family solute receptor
VENIRRVTSGEIEAGLVQADVAAWAFNAERMFQGDARGRTLRAVASLYPEKFQIVVRRDARIRTVDDLRGKHISIDEVGSGTLSVMRIVLANHGMGEEDLFPVYLKPVFTHDKMVKGELQGFVMMAGAPMDAVTRLLDTGVFIVPIGPERAAAIRESHPYLVPGTIPAGVYPGIPETPTLQVHALFVVDLSLDEELVYRVTRALWSPGTLSLLAQGHPQGKAVSPGTALSGISVPLHPGAERYYRENPLRFKDANQDAR